MKIFAVLFLIVTASLQSQVPTIPSYKQEKTVLVQEEVKNTSKKERNVYVLGNVGINLGGIYTLGSINIESYVDYNDFLVGVNVGFLPAMLFPDFSPNFDLLSFSLRGTVIKKNVFSVNNGDIYSYRVLVGITTLYELSKNDAKLGHYLQCIYKLQVNNSFSTEALVSYNFWNNYTYYSVSFPLNLGIGVYIRLFNEKLIE